MDRKLETFLTLCRTMNYRATAEQLHLTQPAITKQIQSLENEYGARLFYYDGHTLHKTDKGRILESYAISLEYNYKELMMAMRQKEKTRLRVGATKTVGDYIIVPRIMDYLKRPDRELSLIVDNTAQLLKMLDENQLDFAIIEGRFDKGKYAHTLYRQEGFRGICSADTHLAGLGEETLQIQELFDQTIIVREEGSGTRLLFESDLNNMGYSLQSFARTIELSSFQLIREAVRSGLGISFAYEAVVGQDPGLRMFSVSGIQNSHEINVVYLPDTNAGEYAEEFLGQDHV